MSLNRLGRCCWRSFILLCLLATLVPKRFVLCNLGVFGGPIYCCLANRQHLIMPFARRVSLLLSLSQVFCSHYLLQKASLYLAILALSWTCLFVMGIMLFSPVLTCRLNIVVLYLILWGREHRVPLQLQSSSLTI